MEPELLLRHIDDLCARVERAGVAAHTAFLTPEERQAVSDRVARRHIPAVFFGGVPEAERTVAFLLPEPPEEGELASAFAEEIACVRVEGDVANLTHRDYLGAVMRLGLERDAVGDILPGETGYILCLPAAARCILNDLLKIGNRNVTLSLCPLEEVPTPEIRETEERFTVKSPRLDAVCGGLFHLSRTEAAERIRRGDCAVNHRPCDKPDKLLSEGDTVTLRGLGRGTLTLIGGKTKKDRLFLTVKRRI